MAEWKKLSDEPPALFGFIVNLFLFVILCCVGIFVVHYTKAYITKDAQKEVVEVRQEPAKATETKDSMTCLKSMNHVSIVGTQGNCVISCQGDSLSVNCR